MLISSFDFFLSRDCLIIPDSFLLNHVQSRDSIALSPNITSIENKSILPNLFSHLWSIAVFHAPDLGLIPGPVDFLGGFLNWFSLDLRYNYIRNLFPAILITRMPIKPKRHKKHITTGYTVISVEKITIFTFFMWNSDCIDTKRDIYNKTRAVDSGHIILITVIFFVGEKR